MKNWITFQDTLILGLILQVHEANVAHFLQ